MTSFLTIHLLTLPLTIIIMEYIKVSKSNQFYLTVHNELEILTLFYLVFFITSCSPAKFMSLVKKYNKDINVRINNQSSQTHSRLSKSRNMRNVMC
ncbi:hypothetical protein HanXRQr2_Chr15g0676551 [Helianthus annuus]|uniref:Uncharacterized protein n=1 Tax=Helianthus annuus TaxID=4232 RepID=A0A9K3DXW0_HELAN|nr:hypothetical protein HanXRQr2_Chr15g0676551 [Helianthus annuus]